MPLPNYAGQVAASFEPKAFNPMATLGDLAQLQNYRALMEQRQAQADKLRQQQQEEADIQQIAQQYPDDHAAFIRALYGKGYAENAAKYEKLLGDATRAAAEAHKSQLDAEDAQLSAGLRTLSGVQDEHSYQIVRAGIASLDPQYDAVLPKSYDPEALRPVFHMAQSAKDWLKSEQDAAQLVIDGKAQEGVARLFWGADTPQKWELAKQRAKDAGMAGYAAMFGDQWSPEAQERAGQILQGPQKPAKDAEGAKLGSFEDYVARKYGPNATPEQILAARKAYGQADDRPININTGGVKPLTAGQALTQTRQLRNDFNKETAAARTVEQQLGLMRASLEAVKKGAAPAGSQGVLVTFQKILDPISVVRESEYARSASGLSLLGRLEGSWMKIQEGGAGVTVKDLEQFVSLAEQFAVNQRKFAAESKAQIDQIAKEYGLKPELITREVGAVNEGTAAAPATPSEPLSPNDVKAPNGKVYHFPTKAQAEFFRKKAGIR